MAQCVQMQKKIKSTIMKRVLLLLILIVTGMSVNAQHEQRRPLRYDNHSNSFFSLNLGSTYHTSNVRSDMMMWRAGGFTWGRSYLYRQGSPVFFDLRGRFLMGSWEGMDRKLTYVSPADNILNGTANPGLNYYASDSSVLRNFRANQFELNAEFVLHFNRLREATKWDFYLFGGIGFTFWKSSANYLNDEFGGSTMYDYNQLNGDFSQSNIQSFLDNSYETDLEGSTDGWNVNWMPHVGVGIGRQLGSRVTIGVEHKTAFTRTDLWDGLNYNSNGQPTGSNDLYHYTGLYLKWYLRGSRPPRQPFVNQPNQPGQPNCFFPQVVITDPMNSHQSSMMQTVVVRADIRNISNRNQITFRVNGQFNNNFTYNVNSGVFQSQVILNPGQNFIEITASNNCGSISDSRVIVFQQQPFPNNPQPQMPPPIVSITNPMFSPHTVEQSVFNIQAQVLNVIGREQIQMTVNGQLFSNFNFNAQTTQLNANITLNQGNNTIVITASNQIGTDSDQTVVIFNRPQQLPPPVVQFVAPTTSSIQVTQPSTAVTANVFNVTNKQDITVTVNGQVLPQSGFNFNANTSTVTFTTPLTVGANTIQISAFNTVGTDASNITVIYQQVALQLPPIVTFVDPYINPFNTISAAHNVSAVVQNVTNQAQIQVWVNNASVSNFTFNASSNMVNFTTGLQVGSNTIRIKATNNAGFDDETTVIIYTPHNPVMPPVVTINSPLGNPALVTQNSTPVNATVLNVELQSGIQVLVNNINITNFTFNPSTHQVDFVAILNPGLNTVVVKGTNSAGQAQATQQISYQQPAQLPPPVVTFVNPAVAGQTVNMPSFEMIATVANVSGKDQIQVMMNGQTVASNLWTWNANTSTVSYHTSLITGLNLFTVTGSNSAGLDSKTLNVNYQVPVAPCNPPTATLNIPSSMNTTVQNAVVAFDATVGNVSNANQITVSLNGTAVQGWNFNSATNKVTGNLNLSLGNNVAEILVNNGCGKERLTFLFVLEPAAPCYAPVINVVSPQNTQIQTQESTIAVSASTLNISNASEVTFYVNGNSVPFNYNASTQILTATAQLVMGANVLRFESLNNCGKGIAQWTVQRTACLKPELNLSSNVDNGTTVNSAAFTLSGTIANVQNAQSITVTKNGTPVNFVFTNSTGAFNLSTTLTQGNNNFVVTAINSCGSESYSIQVTYQEPVAPCNPPTAALNNPSSMNTNVQNETAAFEATVGNVSNANQITVSLNGTAVQGWNFNSATNKVSGTFNLSLGNNVAEILVNNGCGKERLTFSIVFEPVAPCHAPMINVVSPQNTQIQTQETTISVSASTLYIGNASEVTFYVNGNPVPFNFDPATNMLTATAQLAMGANVLRFESLNNCGKGIAQWTVQRTACDKPVFNLSSNVANNSTVNSTDFNLSGTILNVLNAQSISVTRNGTSINFVYNDVTDEFALTTKLFEGNNNFIVTATNSCGSESYNISVNFQKPVVPTPPVVDINQPEASPFNTQEQTMTVVAEVLNVTSSSQIQVTVNGSSVQFNFNPSTNLVTWNQTWIVGQNIIVVSAQNNDGAASDSKIVVYSQPVVVIRPEVVFTNPLETVYSTDQPNFTFTGYITNLTSVSQASAKLNGQSWSNFNGQMIDGLVYFSVPVTFDNNHAQFHLEMKGQNSAGITIGAREVHREIASADDPINCMPTIGTIFAADHKSVSVSSNKQLISVVLKFHDNTTQAFNNLSGVTGTFQGSAGNDKKCIVGIWVKSGCNQNVSGNNVGEWRVNDNFSGTCQTSASCVFPFKPGMVEWQFCMTTPQGTFNTTYLNNNPNFNYQGTASSLFLVPATNGEVLVGGVPYQILADNYYLFEGNIDVSIDKQGSSWNACFTASAIPSFGLYNRPTSPCESVSNPAPSNQGGDTQSGENSQNCMPIITTVYSNGHKTVSVTSNFNLNNVVLKFHDNTTQQFNSLTGKSRTFSGTGANSDKCIVGVWVKSGCNSSNDGPNYGEYFANTAYNNECAIAPPCGPFFSLRSSSWEFCMVTPSGTVNRNTLANNTNYTYQGSASSVYFYAISGGGNVTVNGKPFVIQANKYYLFTGNIQVSVTRNDPSAPGQWMICITTNAAPLSGAGTARPQSPCENAGRDQNTNPNQRPGTNQQNKPGTNPQNKPGTNPNTRPNSDPNPRPGTKPSGTNSGGREGGTAPAGELNPGTSPGGREGTSAPAPGGGRRP
jgi:large repetitive protein